MASPKRSSLVLLGVAVLLATGALVFSLDLFRPVGVVRLLSFVALMLLAPIYFTMGVASSALGLGAGKWLLWVAPPFNATIWVVAAIAAGHHSRESRARQAAVFTATYLALPLLALTVAYAA